VVDFVLIRFGRARVCVCASRVRGRRAMAIGAIADAAILVSTRARDVARLSRLFRARDVLDAS